MREESDTPDVAVAEIAAGQHGAIARRHLEHQLEKEPGRVVADVARALAEEVSALVR